MLNVNMSRCIGINTPKYLARAILFRGADFRCIVASILVRCSLVWYTQDRNINNIRTGHLIPPTFPIIKDENILSIKETNKKGGEQLRSNYKNGK